MGNSFYNAKKGNLYLHVDLNSDHVLKKHNKYYCY